jgi:hypothetical protein
MVSRLARWRYCWSACEHRYDLGYFYFENEDLPYIRMFGLTCVFADCASHCALVGRSTVNRDPSKPMNAYFVTLASLPV